MAASAADIPNRYDVVIDGTGYLYAKLDDQNALSRYGVSPNFAITPTFITRQNVSGDYGDAQQDFWMTFSQRDWSLGDGQRFMRQNDETKSRLFFASDAMNISDEGKVSLRFGTTTLTPAATPSAVAADLFNDKIWFSTATTLYSVATTGVITSAGAHGAGGAPFSMTVDATGDVYMNWPSGALRKYDGSFSDFSATGAQYESLEYLNNTLYALTSSALYQFDTSGTRTTLFTWQGADGGAAACIFSALKAYGGKLLILRGMGYKGTTMWVYDGTAPSMVAEFPGSFIADDLAVQAGTVFISGATQYLSYYKPVVYFYSGGAQGKLWEGEQFTSAAINIPIEAWGEGVIWADISATGAPVKYYNPEVGGTVTIAVSTTSVPKIAAAKTHFLVAKTDSGTTIYQHPSSTTLTTGGIRSSLIDFDSSLTKLFRGIKVEYEAGTDGDGGSVDISYRTGDPDGAYTGLQVAAVSAQEYTLTGVTGRSISIKVTLNKGTSTFGPVLRRVSVRAAPKQQAFRKQQYIIECSGVDGKVPLKRWDGTLEPNDGLTLATALKATALAGVPVTVTDEFGSYTGLIENDGFEIKRFSPGEYIALVPVREV